jgi:hypothetical protein
MTNTWVFCGLMKASISVLLMTLVYFFALFFSFCKTGSHFDPNTDWLNWFPHRAVQLLQYDTTAHFVTLVF